jgi:BRCA1/BRCA2-containing complex subunit 3
MASLKKCTLSWHAFLTCVAHSLSTEKYEVMGLLLGDWEDEEHSSVVIEHALVLTRTEKKNDRVDVEPEQLVMGMRIAEKIGANIGRSTRIVGWYHSHPHITVLPSHIDVKTQGQQQGMDSGFIGLIFSVFRGKQQVTSATIEMTAFQSSKDMYGQWVQQEVPLSVRDDAELSPVSGSPVPVSDALELLVSLIIILQSEDRGYYDHARLKRAQCKNLNAAAVDSMYYEGVYTKSLSSLLALAAVPLLEMLLSVKSNMRRDVESLREKNKALREKLTAEQHSRAEEIQKEKNGRRQAHSASNALDLIIQERGP